MGDFEESDDDILPNKTLLKYSNLSNTVHNEQKERPSVMRLLERITIGSASKVKSITMTVPNATSNIISGITNQIPLPDLLPDAKKIDSLVETATFAAYCLSAFGMMGTFYYTMRTVREMAQYKRWLKYTYLLKQTKKVT